MSLDGTRILLAFGEAVSAPEVIWSLKEAGAEVVVAFRAGRRSAARSLRGIESHEVADPAVAFDEARRGLDFVLHDAGIDAVMPLEDPALVLVESIETDVRRIGPAGSAYELVIDKRLQFETAEDAGFKVPAWESWPDSDRHGGEVSEATGPLVVKPALAGWSRGNRFERGSVCFAADREEALVRAETCAAGEPVILQSVVTGVGQGIFGVGDGGRCFSMSGHRRLRMMNPAGSGSSACISRAVDGSEAVAARRFIEQTGWSGMFMLETLRDDRENVDWFMELNGRPWGSMALARRQGLEYPAWAAELAVGQVQPPDLKPASGVVCRNLGREIMHGLHLLKGNKGNAPNWPRMFDRIQLLGWSPRHRWYNASRGQPSFMFREAARTVLARVFGR